MNSPQCERTVEVCAAVEAGRLMASPSLMTHVDGCNPCSAALGVWLLGPSLDHHLGDGAESECAQGVEATEGLSENEAAILLSGFGRSDVEIADLATDDLDRLRRVASVVDAAAPHAPSAVRRLGLTDSGASPADDEEPGRASARGPRSVWRLAIAAALVVAAGIATWVTRDDAPGLLSSDPKEMRGLPVEMTLGLGPRLCDSMWDSRRGERAGVEARPCQWQAAVETFTMNVQVEPKARNRYVVVLARDESGDVSLLYPEVGAVAEPLVNTRGRNSKGCRAGLCWLGGGRYDVPPGRLSVVAVFASEPLPVEEMAGAWSRKRWMQPGRFVQRFEVEVVP